MVQFKKKSQILLTKSIGTAYNFLNGRKIVCFFLFENYKKNSNFLVERIKASILTVQARAEEGVRRGLEPLPL